MIVDYPLRWSQSPGTSRVLIQDSLNHSEWCWMLWIIKINYYYQLSELKEIIQMIKRGLLSKVREHIADSCDKLEWALNQGECERSLWLSIGTHFVVSLRNSERDCQLVSLHTVSIDVKENASAECISTIRDTITANFRTPRSNILRCDFEWELGNLLSFVEIKSHTIRGHPLNYHISIYINNRIDNRVWRSQHLLS